MTQQLVTERIGRGVAFGTFGEMLQGVLDTGDDFLVTFPITRYTHTSFTSDPSMTEVEVTPQFKQKVKRLAHLMLDHYQLPLGGHLVLESDIPVGKGLASSSADLVSTARAIADFFDIKLEADTLLAFLQQIEPTDGVMFSGSVAFNHRKVQLQKYLGYLPNLVVVGADEGGEIDTVEFNKLPKPFTMEEKQEYRELLNIMCEAVAKQDVSKIGEVATRSALLNQKLRPKRTLNEMIKLCKEIGGLGVVIAHSGTYIGILLWQEDPDYEERLARAQERLLQTIGHVEVFYSWNEKNGLRMT